MFRFLDVKPVINIMIHYDTSILTDIAEDEYEDVETIQTFLKTMSQKFAQPPPTNELMSLEPSLITECQLLSGMMQEKLGVRRLWSETVKVFTKAFLFLLSKHW